MTLEIQKQVAHDIRSPLGILELLVGTLDHVSKEQRELFQIALSRLKGIADDVLNHKNNEFSFSEKMDLVRVTEVLIKEKNYEHSRLPNVRIEFMAEENLDRRVSLPATEYQRVISNLINNAVEALNGQGQVSVSIKKWNQNICIEISDNGVGISASILSKLLKGSLTYGKSNGHGLGLSHARRAVSSWGGKLEIDSTENVGTLVRIILS